MHRSAIPSSKQPSVFSAGRRALATWLALLGLVVQLAMAGGTIEARAATGPFPICHAHATDGSSKNHNAPARSEHCPCCAAHCHAVGTLPAIVATSRRARVIATVATPTRRLVSQAVAVCAAASPRGPPSRA